MNARAHQAVSAIHIKDVFAVNQAEFVRNNPADEMQHAELQTKMSLNVTAHHCIRAETHTLNVGSIGNKQKTRTTSNASVFNDMSSIKKQVHHHEISPIVAYMDASLVNVFAKEHNTCANKVCTTIYSYQYLCFYLMQSNLNRIAMLNGYRISKMKLH